MRAVRRSLLAAVPLLALAAAPARADFTCQLLDVPGSTWTQSWQLNSAGQVAAGSDLGGHIYSGGTWLPLPPQPAGSPYLAADVNALGINDAGVIAGAAGTATSGEAFILSGGSFAFFGYQPSVYPFSYARGIGNNGVVTGIAYHDTLTVGFAYHPSGAPGYAAGFTELVPVLGGVPAWMTIPNGINSIGQIVGSGDFAPGGRHGFLYDPAWLAHGYAGPFTLFQIEGRYTAARGLNDVGQMVGFTHDAAGATVGFLMTSAGHQLFTCPTLDTAGGLFPESINASGVVSGNVADAAGTMHGFIAYPDVVLPVSALDGVFLFDVAVSPHTPVFLDPEPAVGYRYAIGRGNPRFASVTLPIGVGDNLYTVLAGGRAFTLPAGQRLDFTRSGFPHGLAGFAVVGIEPAAGLDPASFTAFVTEVTFATGGRFTGTMTPLTIAGELEDLVRAAGAGEEKDLLRLARRAEKAYAAGKMPRACRLLAALVEEASGQNHHRCRDASEALAAEARAIREALACPALPPGDADSHQDEGAGDRDD